MKEPYTLDQITARRWAQAGVIRLDDYLNLCRRNGWTADSHVIAAEAARLVRLDERAIEENRRKPRLVVENDKD